MNASIDTLDQQPPEVIEREIAATRASLDSKLAELEHRLNPKRYLADWQARLDPRAHMDVVAALLVIAGAGMAIAGWRKARPDMSDDVDLVEEMLDHDLDEVLGASAVDEIIVCE